MRTRIAALAVALALLATGAGVSYAASSSSQSTPVQAQGSEYRIGLSRTKIKSGKMRLEFVNYGEDDHDLAFRRVGTSEVRNVGLTRPGDRSVGRYSVRSGTYLLWCTLSDHRARGMNAKLKVVKR